MTVFVVFVFAAESLPSPQTPSLQAGGKIDRYYADYSYIPKDFTPLTSWASARWTNRLNRPEVDLLGSPDYQAFLPVAALASKPFVPS